MFWAIGSISTKKRYNQDLNIQFCIEDTAVLLSQTLLWRIPKNAANTYLTLLGCTHTYC